MNLPGAPVPFPLEQNRARVQFLRRRYADAIERGDDKTASRLAILLDIALNGRPAARDVPDGAA